MEITINGKTYKSIVELHLATSGCSMIYNELTDDFGCVEKHIRFSEKDIDDIKLI